MTETITKPRAKTREKANNNNNKNTCHVFTGKGPGPIVGQKYKTSCGLFLPIPNKRCGPHCHVCVVCAELNKDLPHPGGRKEKT